MNRNIFSYSAVVASLLATALFAGCGTSNKEGASPSGELASAGSDTSCVQCHGGRVIESFTNEDIMAQYNRTSPHKDSTHLGGLNGCEACHGGAGQHHGVGPIQVPNPYAGNGERCASCHKGDYPTNANTDFATSIHAVPYGTHTSDSCLRCHTHEGALLGNKLGVTGESGIYNRNYYKVANAVNSTGTGTRTIEFQCATCHEHGAGLRPVMAVYSTSAGRDTGLAAWNPSKAVAADAKNNQFNLCTSCHNMYNYDGSKLLVDGSTYSTVATGKVGYHDTSWYRILATTHYDNPNTPLVIEGYNLRVASGNACYDCHGHEAKTGTRRGNTTTPSIYTDWAQSAHGGGILAQKYAATQTVAGVMAVGATKGNAPGWVYYDWDKTSKADGSNDRGECQRCHTATGAANFMKNPAAYNYKDNDFSHLTNWKKATATTATVSSGQNEVLYCWGCHSNAGTGKLRKPGAIVENYAAINNTTTGTTGTAVSVTYPDAGKSNVCMSCHVGREVGENIKATTDADGVLAFINSHYLTAGGTVFGKTGYTYFDRDYNSTAKGFVHDKLGISATGTAAADAYIAANNLSTSGPCAVCHLTSEKYGKKASHTFSPFSLYSTTVKNTALNPVCVTCHTTRGDGSDAKTAWFEDTWKARSDAALAALEAQLALKGIHFYNAHPYFYSAPYVSGGTNTAFTNWAGVNGLAEWKNVMGAAFNYNLFEHDPGAVAHNRYYVRRLIYDSLDYLDDQTANYSVFATLNALDGTTATYKDDAITFLIKDGATTTFAGTAGERF